MKTSALECVICDNCKHVHSKNVFDGHRRRGWCTKGSGWVELGKCRQCLYHEVRGKHGRR